MICLTVLFDRWYGRDKISEYESIVRNQHGYKRNDRSKFQGKHLYHSK